MADLKDLVRDSETGSLNRLIDCNGEKYLLFTRFTTRWVLCVSDGIEIWRLDYDEEELDAHRDLAGISSCEVLLSRVKNAFQSGDLTVATIGNKVTVTVGKGVASVAFDLYEAKAAERKAEMQTILFRLAENVQSVTSELAVANSTIDNLKAQKGAGATGPVNALMDLGPKRGANPAKSKPKKAGMSVINPTSKKRKAASGVVFD